MQALWYQKDLKLKDILPFCDKNLSKHIGIEFTELGPNFLKAQMNITEKSTQPLGLMHGGISCVFAETLGSITSNLITPPHQYALGLSISTSHISPVKQGLSIQGQTEIIHLGRKTHIWEISIYCGEKLVSKNQLTTMILEKDTN